MFYSSCPYRARWSMFFQIPKDPDPSRSSRIMQDWWSQFHLENPSVGDLDPQGMGWFHHLVNLGVVHSFLNLRLLSSSCKPSFMQMIWTRAIPKIHDFRLIFFHPSTLTDKWVISKKATPLRKLTCLLRRDQFKRKLVFQPWAMLLNRGVFTYTLCWWSLMNPNFPLRTKQDYLDLFCASSSSKTFVLEKVLLSTRGFVQARPLLVINDSVITYKLITLIHGPISG